MDEYLKYIAKQMNITSEEDLLTYRMLNPAGDKNVVYERKQ